jgi:hypothetical protein
MLRKIRKSMKVIERKIYESYCITFARKDSKGRSIKEYVVGGNYITENPNASDGYVFLSNFLRTPVNKHVFINGHYAIQHGKIGHD